MAAAQRLKVVIAPDSFKESLSAVEVAAHVAEGFLAVWPDADCRQIPMADGGEGSVATVVQALGGSMVEADVTGPMGEPVRASFGLSADGATAFVEMAAASGLELVALEDRNPLLATSYGTGQLIKAALDAGVSGIVMAIGGSATVDGGAGMLQALGATLLDEDGREIGLGGGALGRIAHMSLNGLDPRLPACRLEVACDVDNPLLGADGAAAVFGPQKGATPQMVAELEGALARFAEVVKTDLGMDVATIRGGGAAGGVGAALVGCLGATMRPGVEMIAEVVGLEQAIREADLVVTGEGRIDHQSLRGKTAVGVAEIAKRHGKPVVVLAGAVSVEPDVLREHGFAAAFSIVQGIATRESAFADTGKNLRVTAMNVASLWSAALEAAR